MTFPIISNGKILLREGRLATSLECCCQLSGSESGSGIPEPNCCEVEYGPWPDGEGTSGPWPESLTATITGACCDERNGTYVLVKGTSPWPGYVLQEDDPSILDCSGNTPFFTNIIGLVCLGGQWVWTELLCAEITGGQSYNCTLLSCSPFHLIVSGVQLTTANYPTLCCDGEYSVEVTE